MAEAGKVLAEIMAKLWEEIKPGITSSDIDTYADALCREYNVLPAFLGVKSGKHKYPAIVCASVNKVVVHGVPDTTPLKATDLLSLDMGVIKDGWYSDMCVPGFVGGKQYETLAEQSDPALADKQRVLRAANAALATAITQCVHGNRLKNVCLSILHTARKYNCRPMLEFVGHGVGRKLHEEPQIPGYWMDQAYKDCVLEEGMVFAVEAILTSGKLVEAKVSREDHWSAWPKDDAPTAVAEHTIAIGNPPRVLTQS